MGKVRGDLEKSVGVWGKVWESVGGGVGKCWERCEKVCWGMANVR